MNMKKLDQAMRITSIRDKAKLYIEVRNCLELMHDIDDGNFDQHADNFLKSYASWCGWHAEEF